MAPLRTPPKMMDLVRGKDTHPTWPGFDMPNTVQVLAVTGTSSFDKILIKESLYTASFDVRPKKFPACSQATQTPS